VITETTGMNTLQFAQKYLFDPMQIAIRTQVE